MFENKIPIIKISVASLAMLLSRYKEILFISILPIILMFPAVMFLPEILKNILNQVSQVDVQNIAQLQTIAIPNEFFIYSLMFLYGYISLNINLYRLVVIGFNGVFKFGIIPLAILLKFGAITLLISLLTFAPYVLKLPILEPIVFLFLAPFMLNLVIIALGAGAIKWRLPFLYRINIALLQFVIPTLVLAVFSLFGSTTVSIMVKIFLIYWAGMSMGLIFNALRVKY